jgi:RNA polymerase primary sigma factor
MYASRVSRRDEDSGTLSAYLREIAKISRLTVDEERALGSRIQHDQDEDALSRLVEANLRFVVAYAKRYRGHGVSFLDLIHEGNLGLIEAARRFDPTRNVKFITYAVWWIRESMMHVLSEQVRAVSFPPKLFATLGHGSEDVSLSEPLVGDGREGPALADVLPLDQAPIEEEIMRQADAHELGEALRDLSGKEREVVRLRYGLEDDEPRTLQEIGDQLHLSRERVRQIEAVAKAKLRRSTRLRSHLN